MCVGGGGGVEPGAHTPQLENVRMGMEPEFEVHDLGMNGLRGVGSLPAGQTCVCVVTGAHIVQQT